MGMTSMNTLTFYQTENIRQAISPQMCFRNFKKMKLNNLERLEKYTSKIAKHKHSNFKTNKDALNSMKISKNK
jgi:hypothetical protein